MKILSKPWSIAIIALISMIGTQLVALKLYWHELFPEQKESVLLVKREDPAAISWGFSSGEIRALQLELEEHRSEIKRKESELAAYEVRLKADRAEIDGIKQEVERVRDELMEGIVQLEASEQKNLRTLAKTYATLTPAATVSIFKELDDPTVVKILFFMKADTVGSILQEMATADGGRVEQVKRAAEISDMLRLFTNNT